MTFFGGYGDDELAQFPCGALTRPVWYQIGTVFADPLHNIVIEVVGFSIDNEVRDTFNRTWKLILAGFLDQEFFVIRLQGALWVFHFDVDLGSGGALVHGSWGTRGG